MRMTTMEMRVVGPWNSGRIIAIPRRVFQRIASIANTALLEPDLWSRTSTLGAEPGPESGSVGAGAGAAPTLDDEDRDLDLDPMRDPTQDPTQE
jgi:hypothetical protein